MPNRVAFSKQDIDIQEFALYYDDVEKSLRLYFSPDAQSYSLRFAEYSRAEVVNELNERLAELEMASALIVLSAIEAAFQIDYLQRCYLKKKDPLSRVFRLLRKENLPHSWPRRDRQIISRSTRRIQPRQAKQPEEPAGREKD